MSKATGETTFSTKGRDVKKFEFTPAPPGNYDAKLDLRKAEVSMTQKRLPQVIFHVELLDCDNGHGKNHKVRCALYPWLKVGKDGVMLTDRDGQLTQLARALDSEVDASVSTRKDSEDNVVKVVDAKAILSWLKSFDGTVIGVKVKHEKDRNDPNVVWARVDSFTPSENAELASEEEEDEEEDEFEEDDDSEDADDEDDEDEDEEDEDEPAPEPEPVKKGRAKAPAKAPAKGKRK